VRVLVVAGTLAESQLALWEAVHQHGVDVHLVGTLDRPTAGGLVPVAPSTILDTSHLPADFPVPTTVVRPASSLAARGALWWRYPELPTTVDALRPTIVHVLSEVWGRLTAQALATKRPVVAHGCENLFNQGSRAEAWIRLALIRRRLPRLAGYVSWNRGGLARLTSLGMTLPGHTAVVPGVLPDPGPFMAVPTRQPGASRTVGFIGRLSDSKGVDTLLRAAAGLPAGTRLIITGSGPEEGRLRRLADDLGVAVEFRSAIAPEQVPAALAELDVVAVPSRPTRETAEQFGRIAVESMWARRPVVATRCGALPEVLGDAALLSDVDDVAALARNLRSALEEDTATLLVERGLERAEQLFAPAHAARALADFWETVAVHAQDGAGASSGR
jgi:glycosyltransferase involved in cell wall biosynthesis